MSGVKKTMKWLPEKLYKTCRVCQERMTEKEYGPPLCHKCSKDLDKAFMRGDPAVTLVDAAASWAARKARRLEAADFEAFKSDVGVLLREPMARLGKMKSAEAKQIHEDLITILVDIGLI